MGTTEHHGAADVIAEPLLPSPAVEMVPRRNMFAFICATLASMTTILMGYSTYTAASSSYSRMYVLHRRS
jgi:hypothetical protein